MSTFYYFMPNDKGPRRPTIELGQPPKPLEQQPDFDENEDEVDAPTTSGTGNVDIFKTPSVVDTRAATAEDEAVREHARKVLAAERAAAQQEAAERLAAERAYEDLKAERAAKGQKIENLKTRELLDKDTDLAELGPEDLTRLPDVVTAAGENRSGLKKEIVARQDVDVRGGDTKDALEKIFVLEKKKLETLLATGEYTAGDFASDIREELSEAELQLRMISEDDETGPAERADLNRVIEVAKYKLKVLEDWQKAQE